MLSFKKTINLLEKQGIKYDLLVHRKVFSGIDKAATLGISQKTIGKTLVVRVDKDYFLVLIPSDKALDTSKLKKEIDKTRKKEAKKPVKEISLAKEAWIKKNAKGVSIGAMPPFGLSVFVDKGFLKNTKIILNSGDNKHSIKMTPASFKKVATNLVEGVFSQKKASKKKKK